MQSAKLLQNIRYQNLYEQKQLRQELKKYDEIAKLSSQEKLEIKKINEKLSSLDYFLTRIESEHTKQQLKENGKKLMNPKLEYQLEKVKESLLEEIRYLDHEVLKRLGPNYVLQYESDLKDIYSTESVHELEYVISGSLLLSDVIERNPIIKTGYDQLLKEILPMSNDLSQPIIQTN